MSLDYPLRAVLKCETNGAKTPEVLCLSLLDIDRDELFSFADAHPGYSPIADAFEVLAVADRVIVHTDYALKALAKLYGVHIDRSIVTDTCTWAGVLYGRQGHKLTQWAERMGLERTEFRGAPQWSPAVQEHCDRDCYLIRSLYAHLQEKDTAQRRAKETELDRILARIQAGAR